MKRLTQGITSIRRRKNFLSGFLRQTKLFFLLLLFLGSFAIAGAKSYTQTMQIPILGFHDIVDQQTPFEKPPYRLTFPTDYSQQKIAIFLEYLLQANYWTLSTQELQEYFIDKSRPIPQKKLGKKPIMITFDDGYLGIHKNVLPVVENLADIYGEKIKLVLFVNPLYLGVDEGGEFLPHLSCEDLREGYQKGFYDVQSHGFSHKNLAQLKSKEIEFELSEAKNSLKKCFSGLSKTQNIGEHLAYPYGSSNREVEKIASKYYRTGFLYDNDLVDIYYSPNKYRLSRMTIGKNHSVNYLLSLAKNSSKLITQK
ncbi:MAG: polysaccharide deacetylase family protein [Microcoleaceae cyanobacterium]